MESWQNDNSSTRVHTKPASTAPAPQHRHEPDTAELVDSFCSLLAATSATLHSACRSAVEPAGHGDSPRQPEVPTQAEPLKVQTWKPSVPMHDKVRNSIPSNAANWLNLGRSFGCDAGGPTFRTQQ